MSAEALPPESTAAMGPRLAAAAIDSILTILLWKLLSSLFDGSFVRTFSVFTAYLVSHYGIVQGSTGATLGKGVMGLRLVNDAGRSPGPVPALVRTALLAIDGLFIGLALMYLTPGHRRFGDALAGTWVVLDERGTDDSGDAPAEAPDTAQPAASGGPEDADGVEEKTSRRRALRKGRAKKAAPASAADGSNSPTEQQVPVGAGVGVALAERPENHDPLARSDENPQDPAHATPTETEPSETQPIGVVEKTPEVIHHEIVDVTNEAAAEHTFEMLGSVLDAGLPVSGPEWDEARGAYIQWDPVNGRLMQYDYNSGAWNPA